MTLTLITDRDESARAFAKLESVVKRGADAQPLTMSTAGGHVQAQYVYWHAWLELWAFPSLSWDETRYWCAYGVLDPKKPQQHRQSPVLLINPPVEGASSSCQGAFAGDDKGNIHYLHGGKVGGGGKHVGKSSFVGSGAWTDKSVPVVCPNGRIREMFDLGSLDDPKVLRSLANYVHAVERFKLGHGRVDINVERKNRSLVPVFVSHSALDSKWCREFVDHLKQANVKVWYDDDQLATGKLNDQLEQAIRERPAFIVVVTDSSIRSQFVQYEVRTAIELCEQDGDRIVMPIKAAECTVPAEWSEYVYLRNDGDKPLTPAQAAVKALEKLTKPTSAI